MIGAILRLFNGGLETYRQSKQIKANEIKRQDELKAAQHAAQLERIKSGEEKAADLDALSIKERGYKDEILMLILIPLVLCFIPDYAPYVEQGFDSLQDIPDQYWWVVGAIVIDTLGMRSMLRYLLENFGRLKLMRRGN